MKQKYMNDYAIALKIPTNIAEIKIISRIFMRLQALGHEETCDRCGGSGHYSFNMMDGTRCFKCGGTGFVEFNLTKKLLSIVKQQVDNNELEPYFQQLKSNKIARQAGDIVMKAWADTSISSMYKWQYACEKDKYPEDYRLSEINAKMYNEYGRILKLSFQYQNLKDINKQNEFAVILQREVKIAISNINLYSKEI